MTLWFSIDLVIDKCAYFVIKMLIRTIIHRACHIVLLYQ